MVQKQTTKTIDMNTPVSFKQAKLLKEKGFDEPCRAAIVSMSAPFYSRGLTSNTELSKEKLPTLMSAPTIAEVVMWLYEKHGIWIHVCYMTDTKTWWWDCYKYEKENGLLNEPAYSSKFNHKSPTEAYQEAIKYCLNKLI